MDYARRLRYGLEAKEHPRKVITEYLNAQLEAGLITCREDALKALRDGGLEIPRQGKDYVTVLDSKSGERLRLKGGISMNLGDLTNRLHERIAKDREEMEPIARSELQHLQQSLRESSSAALNTMASDIAAQSQAARQSVAASLSGLEQSTERWRSALALIVLRNTLIGLALTLGIGIGAWGLMTALSWRLESLQAEAGGSGRPSGTRSRHRLRPWSARLGGIVLMEYRNGRYVVLPSGTKVQPYETRDKRPALRLE